MTYHLRKLSLLRAVSPAETHARHSFAKAAPTAIAAARASTSLAMSMTVALRYLEGRSQRPAASSAAIPDPILS
jgi:hypothetical protein